MPNLFNNELAPLTFDIGFIRAPIKRVKRRQRWANLTGWVTRPETFEEGLRNLAPIGRAPNANVLLASTQNPDCTAIFTNGNSVLDLTERLIWELRKPGYYFVSAPKAKPSQQWFGARQLFIVGPNRQTVRSISLTQQDRGWRFDLNGEPQPFEDFDAYQQRRILDRFTSQMMIDYAAALGLQPWNEDFYQPPFYLFRNRQPKTSKTLAQARADLGIE